MLVEQLMTSEVEAGRPDSTLAEAAAIMWRRDCGVVPIVDAEGTVVGIVTDRDVCIALASRGQTAHEVRAAEVMSNPVHTCNAVDDVEEALALMRRQQVRRLPVLDARGRLAGLLSINDVIRHTKRGKGRRHISRRDLVRTLKAIARPHRAAALPDAEDDDDAREGANQDSARTNAESEQTASAAGPFTA
jgi:CBS domain-containing protein